MTASMLAARLLPVAASFQITGELLEAAPWGSGHINDTYVAAYGQGARKVRYIHQRVNLSVFKEPVAMMKNIERVTAHMRAAGPTFLRPLALARTKEGVCYWRSPDGGFWRTFEFMEGTRSVDVLQNPEQGREAAQAFGEFQRLLSDFPEPRLAETIPGFHDTPARFKALEDAVASDPQDRAAQAQAEIRFAMERKPLAGRLLELRRKGDIPERATHNDTKIGNVMFEHGTGRAVCVVDLDTVMPGLALYDFGDLVRSSISPTMEDEKDLSKIKVRLPVFQALAAGYLETAGGFLTKEERRHLAFSGKLITLETGVRFLADFLQGDHYFKTSRPGQNLDRCRVQFKLVELLERDEEVMTRFVERL